MSGHISREIAARVIALKDGEGRLRPDAVLQDAKDPESPLHGYFEWDDEVAAHSWRIDQARTLIRAVTFSVQRGDRLIQSVAFVRDPDCKPLEQGYRYITNVAGDEEAARKVIIEEAARARAAMLRAKSVAEVLDMADAVDDLVELIDLLKDRVSKQEPPTEGELRPS